MPTEDLFARNDPMSVEVGPVASSPQLTGEKKSDIIIIDPALEWVKKELRDSKDHIEKFRDEAKLCYRFKAGHQIDEKDLKILRQFGRPANAFNTLQKFIRFVSGVERRTPEAVIYRAQEEFDQEAMLDGEGVTRGFEWATRRTDAAYKTSRAFEAVLTCGVGAKDWSLDTVTETKPFPFPSYISPFELVFPVCQDQNMEGTRWRAREVDVSDRDILKKWPDAADYVDILGQDAGTRPDPKEINYTVPYLETENYADAQGTRKKGKRKVMEFQWWDDEEGFSFMDPPELGGKEQWLEADKFATYQRRLYKLFGKGIEGEEEKTRRIFRKMFLLERRWQLGDTGRIVGNRFTINIMTGQWDEEEQQWYGFLRVLMDPQRYANKFFNQMLEMIAHQAKGGMLYEEGVITPKNRKEFEESYTKPGSVNEVAEGSISQNRILQKQLPELGGGTMELLKYVSTMPETVSGLPVSAMGIDQGGNVAQGTQRQRQHAGLILFSEEFDSLSKFKKEEARIVFGFLKLIADGRPLGPSNPYDSVAYRLEPRIYKREYDIFLDDTEHDPTLRAQYAQWMIQLAPTLIRTGWFTPDMLDYFELPAKVRQSIKQSIQQQAQQRAQMQAQGINPTGKGPMRDPKETEARILKITADTELAHAKAEAMGVGRKARDFKTLVSALAEAERVRLEADEARRSHTTSVIQGAKTIGDMFGDAHRMNLERQTHRREHARHVVENAKDITSMMVEAQRAKREGQKHAREGVTSIVDNAGKLAEMFRPEPPAT